MEAKARRRYLLARFAKNEATFSELMMSRGEASLHYPKGLFKFFMSFHSCGSLSMRRAAATCSIISFDSAVSCASRFRCISRNFSRAWKLLFVPHRFVRMTSCSFPEAMRGFAPVVTQTTRAGFPAFEDIGKAPDSSGALSLAGTPPVND